MKDINKYIIEKLRINKDAKLTYYSTELSDIMDVSEEFFSTLHKKIKHETKVLNIKKQSLYTRKDWGDDNFIRIEFPQYMTKDLFHTLFHDLSKYLTDRIENLYTRENSFLPENGKKYGIKYIDILIKKNQNIIEKLTINKDTNLDIKDDHEFIKGEKCLYVYVENDNYSLYSLIFDICKPIIFEDMKNGNLSYHSSKSSITKTSDGYKLNSNNLYEKYISTNDKFFVLLPKNIAIRFLNDILDGKKSTKTLLSEIFDKNDTFLNYTDKIRKTFNDGVIEKYLDDLLS